MKVKLRCPYCNSLHTAERYCKNLDGRCVNVENGEYDFVRWCDECTREGGPLRSQDQLAEERKLATEKQARLLKLQTIYKGHKCLHPVEFLHSKYEYNYGVIYHCYCEVCGNRWIKRESDSGGIHHDYDLGA